MLKAANQALFQETNTDVAKIRQTEIKYYSSVYQSFGTQAALLGGFTFYLLRDIEGDHRWLPDLDSWYAFFATGTILCAVQIILCCLFLQVYGPGLALYGPPGSMAKACEVLKKEQPMIVQSFLFMIFFFVLTTVALFWHALDYIGAILCTCALVIALYYWYKFTHRIYAQLYWGDSAVFTDMTGESQNPMATMDHTLSNPLLDEAEKGLAQGILIEGYLQRKLIISSTSSTSMKWKRFYFVMTVAGAILIYKDQKEFIESKKSTMNERPVFLHDNFFISDAKLISSRPFYAGQLQEKSFTFLLAQSLKTGKETTTTTTTTNNNEENDQAPMVFSTDTEEELNNWKQACLKFAKEWKN